MKNTGFNFKTTYTELPDVFFNMGLPCKVNSPKLILFNNQLANDIGCTLLEFSDKDKALILSGQKIPKNQMCYSQAYAGHQFGCFTILGDGRAHIMGEHVSKENKRYDIQFKGSGLTPYSRGGDGLATLGPMLREYIVSEAMYHLNIPTTRSLAVTTTGKKVMRDQKLPGAILTRVSNSLIRVGTFEFAASLDNDKLTSQLIDHTVKRSFPEIKNDKNIALNLLKAVMQRQIDLIIKWMQVGFIHGVMNTDNTSIVGETMDYGPCAFMDLYSPLATFSSIDYDKRYSFGNQPRITKWNMARFAESLLPFICSDMKKSVEIANGTLNQFDMLFQKKWLKMMQAKIGIFGQNEKDQTLIEDLLILMKSHNADFTNTFYTLSQEDPSNIFPWNHEDFKKWYARWKSRLELNNESFESSIIQMRKFNPAVICRNHVIEHVLKKALAGDIEPISDFLRVLSKPYDYSLKSDYYQNPPNPDEKIYQTFCGT